MKISKLFHWLYAILMLLPCFFIGGRVLYTIFNKNAKDSYNGAIAYQQNIPVEKPSDLLPGKTYDITILNNVASQTSNASYRIGFSSFTLKDYLVNNGLTSIQSASYFTIGGAVGYTDNSCFAWYDSNLNYLNRTQLPLNNDIVNNLKFVFTELNTTSPAYFNDSFKDLIKVSNNVLVYEDTLDNAFSYSMEQLNDNPIFAWAQTSFLVAPFAYITGLFGLAASNPINTLLSYWLSISIIWLVFDLVMYVPLLVHRWLDKGVLE